MTLRGSSYSFSVVGVRPRSASGSAGGGSTCQPPHAGEVEGRAHQRHFDSHFAQTAQPEAPQPALLFQDSDHRFDQRLALAIASLNLPEIER